MFPKLPALVCDDERLLALGYLRVLQSTG